MLALIAGQGTLPGKVAASLSQAPIVCTLEGSTPDGLDVDFSFRVEHLGSAIAEVKSRGATQVCFCGGIRRPAIDPSQIDAATMPLVPAMMAASQQGDDGALRAVIGFFEDAGLEVLAAHELCPDLLLPAGAPTLVQPDDQAAQDALVGDKILKQMGAEDLGQACVISRGERIAREDDAGTDAMLAGLPSASADVPRTGILFKAPKPGQDRRIDLPVIGPQTAKAAALAGLAGIVIEAGGLMVLEQERVIEILDAAGMFLWVRERPL